MLKRRRRGSTQQYLQTSQKKQEKTQVEDARYHSAASYEPARPARFKTKSRAKTTVTIKRSLKKRRWPYASPGGRRRGPIVTITAKHRIAEVKKALHKKKIILVLRQPAEPSHFQTLTLSTQWPNTCCHHKF